MLALVPRRRSYANETRASRAMCSTNQSEEQDPQEGVTRQKLCVKNDPRREPRDVRSRCATPRLVQRVGLTTPPQLATKVQQQRLRLPSGLLLPSMKCITRIGQLRQGLTLLNTTSRLRRRSRLGRQAQCRCHAPPTRRQSWIPPSGLEMRSHS